MIAFSIFGLTVVVAFIGIMLDDRLTYIINALNYADEEDCKHGDTRSIARDEHGNLFRCADCGALRGEAGWAK